MSSLGLKMKSMNSHGICLFGMFLETRSVQGNSAHASGHAFSQGSAYTLKFTSGAFFLSQPKNKDSRKMTDARFWPKASSGLPNERLATLSLLTRSPKNVSAATICGLLA